MMLNRRFTRVRLISMGIGLLTAASLLLYLASRYETVQLSFPADSLSQVSPLLNRHDIMQDHGSVQETYLVFYGKPRIVKTLGDIAKSRGWTSKLILTHSGMLSQLRNLASPERFLVVIAGPKAYNDMLLRQLANSTNVLISYIQNADKFFSTKEAQVATLRIYFQSHGCFLEDTAVMPRSFILDDQNERNEFFRYASSRPDSLWLHKPTGGMGGHGITIHSNLTFFYRNYNVSNMKMSKFIAQEYITNLLLLNKRKFDIRAYILVAKTFPHYLVFYHKGYLKVATKEFDIHGGRDVHLTNTHVQAKTEDFIRHNHLQTFEYLQDYLNEHWPEVGRNFVSQTLEPYIQKVGMLLVQAGIPVFSRAPSNYIFLGLDIIVTNDLSVKFIEVNHIPAILHGTPFLDTMVPQMISDMIDLLFHCRHYPEQFQNMLPGEMYGTWTLVWNEFYEQHSNSKTFNPCKEFM